MASTTTGRRAGTYAQRRYAAGRRRWLSQTRPILAVFLGPFIIAGLTVLVADGHLWSWSAGAIAGVAAGVWLTMRDAPPGYIENWHDGAEGERKTARALKSLERSGLSVVHDVDSPFGNYDHIAVGGAGVFMLESKNLGGIVELRGGVPHLQRRLDPQADRPLAQIRPRALGAAACLKKEIKQRTGLRTWVQAVVVFWSDFPQGLVDDGRCVFVHGPRLAGWIGGRPSGLSQADVDAIGQAITEMGSGEAAE
jgi:hypothetical protein